MNDPNIENVMKKVSSLQKHQELKTKVKLKQANRSEATQPVLRIDLD
jgi:hypothetical protein